MKYKDYIVGEATFRVKKEYDRYYTIILLDYEQNCSVYPIYPTCNEVIGEVIIKGKNELSVISRSRFYPDYKQSTITQTFKSALEWLADLLMIQRVHEALKITNSYYTTSKEDFYIVEENSLIWVYHINELGEQPTSDLIVCLHNRSVLEYFMRIFDRSSNVLIAHCENINR